MYPVSHDWSVAMDGYRLFRKDRQGGKKGKFSVMRESSGNAWCCAFEQGWASSIYGLGLMVWPVWVAMWWCLLQTAWLGRSRWGEPSRLQEEASRLQALTYNKSLNHPVIWKGNIVRYKQFRNLLECTDYIGSWWANDKRCSDGPDTCQQGWTG